MQEQREKNRNYRIALEKIEKDNFGMMSKYKRHRGKAIESEMFLKQAYAEIDGLREVTVAMQKQNLGLRESPMVKVIEVST